MKRHVDRITAGQSTIVPFDPLEGAKSRHARRLVTNLAAHASVQSFCEAHGIAVAIKNDGQHWIFMRDRARAEWWPSSEKLVFDAEWRRGIHAHDHEQVIRILTNRWVRPEGGNQ